MKHKILPVLIVAAALTSCSSVYKSGQTPDDVYYSPLKKYNTEEDKQREEQVKSEEQKQEERQETVVRYSINDRRWRDFEEDDNDYNRYNHHCNCYCNNKGYGYYNNQYNRPPYLYAYYTPKSFTPPVNNTPRMVNLQAYKPNPVTLTGKNNAGSNTTNSGKRVYNNSNESGLGKVVRRILGGSSSSSSSSSSESNSRTYSPSSNSNSSSSSGSSSSGSSGTTVTRPGRG